MANYSEKSFEKIYPKIELDTDSPCIYNKPAEDKGTGKVFHELLERQRNKKDLGHDTWYVTENPCENIERHRNT